MVKQVNTLLGMIEEPNAVYSAIKNVFSGESDLIGIFATQLGDIQITKEGEDSVRIRIIR